MFLLVTVFTRAIFALAYFSHLNFSSVFEGSSPIFLSLEFCILTIPHGNPFMLQKLAVCHFVCPSGM